VKIKKTGNPNLNGTTGSHKSKLDEYEKGSELYSLNKSVESKEAKIEQLKTELANAKEKLESVSFEMQNPNTLVDEVKSLGSHKFALNSQIRGLESALERAKQDWNLEAQHLHKTERRCYDLKCMFFSGLRGGEHLSKTAKIHALQDEIAERETKIDAINREFEDKQESRANEFKRWTNRNIESEQPPSEDVIESTQEVIPWGVGRSRFGTAAHADASWQPAR
jgi:predicted  nucleic acid-binding Zn-ribbon protein